MTYEHRYHAGNVGDVLKHAAHLALIDAVPGPRLLIDTHAGAGEYALGPTGEWTEGIGQLLAADLRGAPQVVLRYVEAVRPAVDARRYPGSPRLAASISGAADRLVLHELADETRSTLSAAFRGDRRVVVSGDDGFAALPRVLEAVFPEKIALIDPPFGDRSEWTWAADVLIACARTGARLMLWYPIKSYARPNAMLARLEKAAIPAAAIELITSPLTSKKNRLNGSGLVLVSPPEGLIETLASAVAWLGPRLSAQNGWWTSRMIGLGSRPGT